MFWPSRGFVWGQLAIGETSSSGESVEKSLGGVGDPQVQASYCQSELAAQIGSPTTAKGKGLMRPFPNKILLDHILEFSTRAHTGVGGPPSTQRNDQSHPQNLNTRTAAWVQQKLHLPKDSIPALDPKNGPPTESWVPFSWHVQSRSHPSCCALLRCKTVTHSRHT